MSHVLIIKHCCLIDPYTGLFTRVRQESSANCLICSWHTFGFASGDAFDHVQPGLAQKPETHWVDHDEVEGEDDDDDDDVDHFEVGVAAEIMCVGLSLIMIMTTVRRTD